MPIQIERQQKSYVFTVNGFVVRVLVDPWNDIGVHPLDVLQKDLEAVLQEVGKMERFKLSTEFTLPPEKPLKDTKGATKK